MQLYTGANKDATLSNLIVLEISKLNELNVLHLHFDSMTPKALNLAVTYASKMKLRSFLISDKVRTHWFEGCSTRYDIASHELD